TLFTAIELLSLVVFTIEYALRVWVAAEHAPARHSSERTARWKFVSSPLGVIDLLAVLPFWLAFLLPVDLRVLLVFRMGRFLKLARYSPAMRSLLDALYNERRALFGCFVILIGATLLVASIMHVIERHAQPRQIRHHSRRDVVGDRHPGDDRIWRRGSGDRARTSSRIRYDLRWIDHDRVADWHHRHRLRRRNSSPRLCRHLGNGRARAFVRRTAGNGYCRHHPVAARAAIRGRGRYRQTRRARAFHVFHRRRGSGDRAPARTCSAGCRSFLRRGRSAASHPQIRTRAPP